MHKTFIRRAAQPDPQADTPTRHGHFTRRAGVLALAVATVTGAGLVFSPGAFAYGPDSPPSAADARNQWNDLRLAGNLQPEDNGGSYDRARFPHWRTVGPPPGQPNRNCAADKWTKIRDRSAGTVNGCEVTNGQWLSGYDGQTVTNPDIDHVVPLREAWVSGADDWTDDQRAIFANDVVVNLVAVSPSSNRSKGDRDPGKWMPAQKQCEYLTWWVEVKVKYDLTFDNDEYTAVTNGLRNC
ncbi:HNH endonuclease family protein (plasmid) [Streptomyces sp. QTS52]